MKHNYKITIILLIIFLLAQFIGVGVIYKYIDHEQSVVDGATVFKELPIGERPPIEEGMSFIPLILMVLIGTGILLLLIKYNLHLVWKVWFLLAVVIALTISWGAFIQKELALFLALAIGIWKVFRPNVWVHNLTEIFVYGGIAAIFVPLFNVFSVGVLLVLISLYDAYAVWKSKHMVTLAKSQMNARVFAGLMLPYKEGKLAKIDKSKKKKGGKEKTKPVTKGKMAILGGGDIAFPLIFAGVLLKEFGLWQSLLIPIFSAVGLGFIFWKGDSNKIYPAMPFISVGCFIGLAVVLLAQYLL